MAPVWYSFNMSLDMRQFNTRPVYQWRHCQRLLSIWLYARRFNAKAKVSRHESQWRKCVLFLWCIFGSEKIQCKSLNVRLSVITEAVFVDYKMLTKFREATCKIWPLVVRVCSFTWPHASLCTPFASPDVSQLSGLRSSDLPWVGVPRVLV